jgi:tRNA-dihydrouridine synthase B
MKIGKIEIDRPIALAPMEGITDQSFRVMCRRMGAGLVYSEFIASEALIRDSVRSQKKMIIHDEERPACIQIFGSKIASMVESAHIVEDSGADFLDINFGCWVRKVVGNNAGAAFLKEPERLLEMAAAVASAVKIPVTIKTRLGWDSKSIVILEIAEKLEQTGVQALTLHCRTREMGMRGDADWSWIDKVKAVTNLPVILNGDVKTAYDAQRAFATTKCDGIMIGRAATGNPFLFYDASRLVYQGIEPQEPTPKEKIDVCLEHLRLMMEIKGLPKAIYEFRKHYAGYLKGYYGASEIKQKLMTLHEYAHVEQVLVEYRDFLIDRQENPATANYFTSSEI